MMFAGQVASKVALNGATAETCRTSLQSLWPCFEMLAAIGTKPLRWRLS
jgi:hypothetical protein